MNRIPVNPRLLIWARERAGLSLEELRARFPKLAAWERGGQQPTFRQLEAFARAVHVPIGTLFLTEPPHETLPVPDLRTVADEPLAHPSPELLDTLYLCQQRQDWFREYAQLHGLQPVPFVGTARVEDDPVGIAEMMRNTLSLGLAEREQLGTWTEALRHMMERAEEAGVLVMASSIVGTNTRRKLEVEEFRGFALADDLAPLVFINASDSKAAQMFTLAHELAHLWLGQSGVSDAEVGRVPGQRIERWCNAVAAELLVPMVHFRAEYRRDVQPIEELPRLARVYKVSTLVVLRRMFDAGFIDEQELREAYRQELERVRSMAQRVAGGGDFYRTLGVRVGKRFAEAVVVNTLEGYTLFEEAFRLLGIRKSSTFYSAARELGVPV